MCPTKRFWEGTDTVAEWATEGSAEAEDRESTSDEGLLGLRAGPSLECSTLATNEAPLAASASATISVAGASRRAARADAGKAVPSLRSRPAHEANMTGAFGS